MSGNLFGTLFLSQGDHSVIEKLILSHYFQCICQGFFYGSMKKSGKRQRNSHS